MIGAMTATAFAAGVTYAALRTTTPRGKGVYVRSVAHADSPQHMVDLCRAMGLKWAALLYAWQKPDRKTIFYYLDRLPSYADALKSAGIDVWLWAWPEPGQGLELARVYYSLARRCHSQGLILNPEKPFYGKSNALARQVMRDCRLTGAKIGVTTYGGGPVNHPGFPWQGFSSADFGAPQFYDTSHKYDETHVARWIRSWIDGGFRTLAPIWGASSAHTPEQMRIEAAQTLAAARTVGIPIRAASWWDFYHLEKSEKRRRAVTSISLKDATKEPIA